jgi:hypothetical protein
VTRAIPAALALCWAVALALALGSRSATPPNEQLVSGADLYAFHCAVCHGEGGLGFSEARLAFPKDHRYCEGCHRPHNPRRMTLEQMTPHFAFSLGDPPALAGEGVLTAFPNALALFHYLRAAMPRHEPGHLDDDSYLAITAYLLYLNGLWVGERALDAEGAASVAIR